MLVVNFADVSTEMHVLRVVPYYARAGDEADHMQFATLCTISRRELRSILTRLVHHYRETIGVLRRRRGMGARWICGFDTRLREILEVLQACS